MTITRIISISILLAMLIGCSKDQQCSDPSSLTFESDEECLYLDSIQRALYFKFTGTWCPPCGSEGAVKMRNALNEYPQLIGIEVHHQDEMTTPLGNKWVTYFANTHFPSFYVNTGEGDIEEALTGQPDFGLVTSSDLGKSELEVKVWIRALKDRPARNVHLAIYLIEDGYVAPQYATDNSAHPEWEYRGGRYPEYIHDRIFRDEAHGHIFGASLSQNPWSKGDQLTYEVSLPFPEDFQGHLYPIAVLWENDQGHFTFLKAFSGR